LAYLQSSEKYIRHKHKVYIKYKYRDHPACIKANKKARAEIKKARINFERKLANSIESDTKSFFAYVKRNSEAKIKVGPILDSKGLSVSASEDRCNEFKDFFASVFTEEKPGSVPEAERIFKETATNHKC